MNIGDPVKYDFKTPDHIKSALINAVKDNKNYYTDSEGLPELKKAVTEKESQKGMSVTEDDVLITNGVSEGLDMILASIVDPNSVTYVWTILSTLFFICEILWGKTC